jgi:uncharacterized protein YjdB
LITAKSAGNSTITCKANDGSGKSATCTVTVKSVVGPVASEGERDDYTPGSW